MRLIRDMGERARTAGAWGRDLINTFQELKDAIHSIDKERIPNPKEAIQALRRSVSVVGKAGLDELKKLREAIQDLQDAIDSLRTKAETQMPDLPVAEWWWNLKNVLDKLKKAIPSINEIQIPRVDDLPLDKIAEVIAGFGVPGLVLVMLMTSSPWFGAAAITSSLAALGPFGMLSGIAALGILQFMSRALTKFGFEKVFSAVIVKLEEDGKTCEEIREEIGRYPISEELKRKLAEDIKSFTRKKIMSNERVSLTPAQRLHFDIYGFVLLENVLNDDEIERMKGALYRMKADENLDATRVYARGKSEHHVLFGNLVAYDPALLEYAAHPKLVPLVEELVGGAVRLEETEAIINSRNPEIELDELYKRRYNPTGFHRGTQHGWGTYVEQNKFHCIFVKTLAYLTDVGPDDGGTCVIPGSHRLTWDHKEMIEAALSDDKLIYQVEASAGSVLLFAEALIHSTTAIRSDKERVILISGYTPPMVREWPGNEVSPEFVETLPEDIRPLISGSDSWHWKRRY